ncbi:aldo/keto reductase [Guyparkeria hydrothermalis]|uniref:aldo/keto reductase n=1 Tax=Guyparkeria TaxID=2035712 RepID=UPI0010AD494F|nr:MULTISPECIES: aldo/keto reductase [Guyparkeria]MCL7750991.1 aldo/keto reductase [Guyparkeria hydrothermalis]TKA88901.1 aldo/keto reductase [Guyparkeria sp. SB14A]
MAETDLSRRRALQLAAAGLGGTLGAALGSGWAPASLGAEPLDGECITRPLPDGQDLPAIGMGTWITFNVGSDPEARTQRTEVLRAFLDAGGELVDSSPMYGSSEAVVGHALAEIGGNPPVFAASKVWTPDGDATAEQVAQSERRWGLARMDLMQVHNLVAWEPHLEHLLDMREQGRLRFVGITTSHGRRHAEIERIMREWPIDFVQASYSLANREAEERLLPLAGERGIAFIANRPFQGGRLIDRVKRHPFPDWALEAGLTNWADFLLKFLIAHPAVTCAIPATSRVEHMRENMTALRGPLPDERLRRRMAEHLRAR